MSAAPCGAGKTFAQTKCATSITLDGHRVMLVQATKKLIRQTAAGLEDEGCPRVTPICGPDPDDEREARYSNDVVGRSWRTCAPNPRAGKSS